MRTETIIKTYYQFSELPEDIKQKAIKNLCDINIDYEWWVYTYEDAERIGLKITEFDLGRASYVKADFIEDACFTAEKIKTEHGESCDTYQKSVNFLKERDDIVNNAKKDENGDFVDEYDLDNQLDNIESEFLKNLCEDYRIILQKEYEYLTSEESIIETIESNEYEFDEKGQLA